MSLGLRLKTDDGKFADIIVFNGNDWNHPLHSHWRKSMRAAILWTPDKSGYASPDFTVNGVRFWLDTSGSSKFYRVGTKNIQVFPSATEQNIACLFYDEVHDKMYLAKMTWSGTGGGLGRAFWTTGDTVFQRTGYANQKTYPEALAICQEKYISGNSDTQGLIFDGNSYGMQYGNFLNFSIDFYNGTAKFNSNSPTYNIFDMNGQVLIGTLAQAKALFGEGLIGYDWDNPYTPGDYADPEGDTGPSDGEYSLPQDELALGGSPYNDMSAGLYRAYAMTAAQLTDFSDQLWNTNVLDALSRFMQNPADIVLSLMSFPFDVDSAAAPTQIGFNWLDAWNLSSIVTYGYRIADGHNQHIEFGKITIPKYSGTFYDYGPYSSIELHLPYIGFVPLKMNECVGRNLYVDYYVDVITGDFTAEVTSAGYDSVPNKFAYGTPLLGLYQGNIGRPLPLTQQNLWQVYKKIGETAVAAIVAGAGAGLGAAAGSEADRFTALEAKYKKAGEGGAFSAQLAREYQQLSDSGYTIAKRSGLAGTANAILNMQSVNAPIVRNGSVDGSNGRTSSQECFVVISVPDQDVPDNQSILGYPSNIPGPLSKVSGYTEVREIRLHSTVATSSELAELEEIVRGGIII